MGRLVRPVSEHERHPLSMERGLYKRGREPTLLLYLAHNTINSL